MPYFCPLSLSYDTDLVISEDSKYVYGSVVFSMDYGFLHVCTITLFG